MTKSKALGAGPELARGRASENCSSRKRKLPLSRREQLVEEATNGGRRLGGVWGGNASPREREEEQALRSALSRARPENAVMTNEKRWL